MAVSSHLKKQAHDLGLCIWQCDWRFTNKDPVLAYVENTVTAALLGPKLPVPIWGYGKTADEAVENAATRRTHTTTITASRLTCDGFVRNIMVNTTPNRENSNGSTEQSIRSSTQAQGR